MCDIEHIQQKMRDLGIKPKPQPEKISPKNIVLSKHGIKRVRQRVGLNKRSISHHIEKVLEKGVYLEYERGDRKINILYNKYIYVVVKDRVKRKNRNESSIEDTFIFVTILNQKQFMGYLNGD